MSRRPPIAVTLLPLLAPLLGLAGCVSGPDYRGGPSSDEPHGWVSPGADVSVWKVDGQQTATRNFTLKVAPGRRRLLVRLQHPIESEDAEPYDWIDLPLHVDEGRVYYLDVKQPADLPPYQVVVRAAQAH